MQRLFAEESFDGVVHLAAMAGVRPSLLDPLHYQDVNIRGTLILLEELKVRPETRFVFGSSSKLGGSCGAITPLRSPAALGSVSGHEVVSTVL